MPEKKEKAKDRDLLPAPRMVNGGKYVQGNGYPELPPVFVPHPVTAPREFEMRALSTYVIEPPDILLVEVDPDVLGPRMRGEQLVRPDGSIGFGTFAPIFVAGLTLDQIKLRLADTIFPRASEYKKEVTIDKLLTKIRVDVLRYNSKFYYVITDGGGYGEQVIRIPLTGNERVLDAIAQINGLPAVSSKKRIWVARATPSDHGAPMILPVDWCGIVQKGFAGTNYQLFPGDRVYVNSDALIRTDSYLSKILAPIERLLGITLLGSSTVNSIRNSGVNGNNTVPTVPR